jgi:hypothetical protein
MFIYGHFERGKGENTDRLDLQISTDITPEILQRAAEDPVFQIINTRTQSYYLPDEFKPEGGVWIRIEPNLD